VSDVQAPGTWEQRQVSDIAEGMRGLRFVESAARQDNPRFGTMCPDLSLILLELDDQPAEVLIQADLFLEPMLEWLETNEALIRDDPPVMTQLPGETIGQTLARGYEFIDDDMDVDLALLVYKTLYQYNSTHNIVFGAPGMQIPRVLIGYGADGFEVCNWIDDRETDTAWRHLIDIDDFFANLPSL
jgi:hypothetical protein